VISETVRWLEIHLPIVIRRNRSQQLQKQVARLVRLALIALVIVLGSQMNVGRTKSQPAAMQPMLLTQVFAVYCTTLASISPTYAHLC
jgi:hypothetical protein